MSKEELLMVAYLPSLYTYSPDRLLRRCSVTITSMVVPVHRIVFELHSPTPSVLVSFLLL